MMASSGPGYFVTLIIFAELTRHGLCGASETFCKGKQPGYYADTLSGCRSYLLCFNSANTRGLQFNCPPGTKFSGATQVCHHEAAVNCSQEEGENKNPPGIVISKQIAGSDFLSETNNNFIGGQSSGLGDDYGRFKREKLTDKTRNTTRTEKKLLPDERRPTYKTKSKNKKANKKPVFKHFKKKFSGAPPRLDDNVVKSKEVVKFLKLEHNDDVNNCSQSRLCKSRKKEIKGNLTLSSSKISKNKKTGHPFPPTVPDKNAPQHKNSEKSIKVAAKLSLIKKEVTTQPSETRTDEDETEEMSDNLNVKPPPEVVLIPQSLDDDTNIKLIEDTVIRNPIKSDSEILQNKSKTELKADIPISSPWPSTTASPHKKNLSFRTKPLNKLPFSRVVAAQKKRRPGEFSPYIPFPDLLSNLTQSARSVRMIPIAISSSEADYIRKLLRSQNRKKPRPGPQDHPRLPRKIDKNQTEKKVASKESDNQEYQIIFKDSQESKDQTTTIGPRQGNKEVDESGDVAENASAKITVRPRGPPKGFFNREKFKQILKSNLRTDRDQSRASSTNNEINLEFGFNPIKKTNSGGKHREKKKAVYFSENDVYFDEYLDTLQAPGLVSASRVSVASVRPGPGSNSIQSSGRSPRHFPHPSPSSPSRSGPDTEKHDRKSNLDFLGIFDTRKYFFIPPNRRSDTSDEQQQSGIFSKLVNLFQN